MPRFLPCWLALLSLFLPASGGSEAPEPPPAFLLEAPGVRSLGPETLDAQASQFPFAVGERLDYAVSWWGIDVGDVRIEVARLIEWKGLRLAHVVATARTNEFFSLLYNVDDRSESWIDIDALRTVRTATLTRHAEKETWEEVEFDWKTHLVHVVEEKRHATRIKQATLDTGPFLYDTFDALYALRSLPWGDGLGVDMPIYASRKIYGLHVDGGRTEKVDDPVLGEIEALVLRPYDSIDGKPADDGAGEVWVQASPPHVPFRLRGWFRTVGERLRVGGVRVDLAAYRGAAPGWSTPAFVAQEPREWPARTEAGAPIWEIPPAVQAAREADELEPGKNKVHGVLSPLRVCASPEASRQWARLALESTPCPSS